MTALTRTVCRETAASYGGRPLIVELHPGGSMIYALKMAIGRRARTLREAIRIVRRAAKPGNYTGSPVWVRCPRGMRFLGRKHE